MSKIEDLEQEKQTSEILVTFNCSPAARPRDHHYTWTLSPTSVKFWSNSFWHKHISVTQNMKQYIYKWVIQYLNKQRSKQSCTEWVCLPKIQSRNGYRNTFLQINRNKAVPWALEPMKLDVPLFWLWCLNESSHLIFLRFLDFQICSLSQILRVKVRVSSHYSLCLSHNTDWSFLLCLDAYFCWFCKKVAISRYAWSCQKGLRLQGEQAGGRRMNS